MAHPKDRSGITRRQLARGAAGAVAASGVAAGLAACENTTTPVGAEAAGATGAAAELVVQKPTGPGGLPLPRTDNSVTWAITEENKPIKDGLKPEPGPLRIYNYADYLDPATIKRFQKQFSTKVEIATYNSSDEAVAKLSSGAVDFDLIVGLTGANIVDLIAHKLLVPLNRWYLPNLEKNVWAPLVDPFYDRDSHYTVPYVVWMDGIGWRNDKVDPGPDWRRRHGRRVSRTGHKAGPAGRAQSPADGHYLERGGDRTLPPRGAHGVIAESSEHLHDLRLR